MEVQFRREMNHTYMILETTDQAVLESYETKILLNNRISGLLPCSLKYLDNKTCFCYDVTSRQSVKNRLEGQCLGQRELRRLLGNILSAMSRMEDYLLSANHLVLLPDQIFVAPDNMSVSLCFAPFYEEDVKEGLLRVTDFLLTHTGSGDQEAVILGSRFAHVLRQPNIRLTDLERAVYGNLPGAEDETAAPYMSSPGVGASNGAAPGPAENAFPASEKSLSSGRKGFFSKTGHKTSEKEKNNKPQINRYVLAVVAAGLIIVGEVYVFLHYYNRHLPPWPVTLAGAVLAAASLLAVIISAGKALKKVPDRGGGQDVKEETQGFDGNSPYQDAYGKDVWGGTAMADGADAFSGTVEEKSPYRCHTDNTTIGKGSSFGMPGMEGGTFYGTQATSSSGSAPPFKTVGAESQPYNGWRDSVLPAGGPPPWTSGAESQPCYGCQDRSASPWYAEPYPVGRQSGAQSSDSSGSASSVREEMEETTLLCQPEVRGRRAYLIPEAAEDAASGHLPEGKPSRSEMERHVSDVTTWRLLEGNHIRIGKLSGSVDICLDSQAVSRLHAEIICRGDHYYIRDLNSLNGTAVNGEVLTGHTDKHLKDGDHLRLADQRFIFRIEQGMTECQE